jgi:hypothetical protein
MKKYLMCPLLQGADNTWVRDALRPYFGTVPRTITLKASTGCNTLKDANGKAAMDHGCLGFAISHHFKIGYFLTFKKIKTCDFRVVILNYSFSKVRLRSSESTNIYEDDGQLT